MDIVTLLRTKMRLAGEGKNDTQKCMQCGKDDAELEAYYAGLVTTIGPTISIFAISLSIDLSIVLASGAGRAVRTPA
jgi:hypothetical protein